MTARPSLAEALRGRVLVADGATGTLLDAYIDEERLSRPEPAPQERDLLPLERPDLVGRAIEAYLAAGADIVKTATFNASARGLARLAPGGNAADLARSVNAAAAALARRLAGEASAADGRPRWVAGSVGPGSTAPSLGGPGVGELAESYLPQMLGLIEGGVDLVLIETVQDTLQCKAAIMALRDAGLALGREVPFIASATVDARGRLLSGADAGAFAAIIEPFGPLALGLNCSGGPGELASAFASLAAVSSAPLCLMPNAGLPSSVGGQVSWPLSAEDFARATASLGLSHGASIVGGCCGTGPGHIAALARAVRGAEAGPRPGRAFALASGFGARRATDGLLVVDERANASGSAAFRTIVKSGDLAAAGRFVVERAGSGPAAVDLSVSGYAPDEAAALASLVAAASPVAAAALSLDTTDEAALAAALPLAGGRPLVNSVNLEDEAKAARIFDLARRYGAAVVCLAMDARGPARAKADKLAVSRRLYDLALSRGLQPEDLAFDTCTFPAASGDRSLAGSALETLGAVAGLGAVCPGSISILGVGNVSYGLPKALRPAFTARFLARARAAGLGAAIVDPAAAVLCPPDELAAAMDAVLDGRDGALERLLALGAPELAAPAEDARAGLSPLDAAVFSGDQSGAGAAVSAALEGGAAPEGVAAAIAKAMAELGRRYDAGTLALPLVLRSADAARAAFAALREKRAGAGAGGPRVVMSTVKGDLHDIGKNLVCMVLEAAGFSVDDLGTDRSAEDIAVAAAGSPSAVPPAMAVSPAIAVGVSGLLTRSLAEMEKVARALADSGSEALLLCGGAAVDRGYVERAIEPARPGLVAYAADPFEAVRLIRSPRSPDPESAAARPASAPSPEPVPRPSFDEPAFEPPFTGSRDLPAFGFEALAASLDRHAVARSRWGYADGAEADAAVDRALAAVRAAGGLSSVGRYGFYAAQKRPLDTIRVSDGAGALADFAFPRGGAGRGLSVCDWFSPSDAIGAFAVTLGRAATDYLSAVRAAGDSRAYLEAHGVLAGLAEAAAELAHGYLAGLLGVAGRRYSFGFPGCPSVEANAALLRLLGADEVGLRVTGGFQLDPEFSVTAVVVARPGARYIDAEPGASGQAGA